MNAIQEGPRHRAWRKMMAHVNRVKREVQQFNTDLASCKENNPACANLDIQPIEDYSPELPPEPDFTS